MIRCQLEGLESLAYHLLLNIPIDGNNTVLTRGIIPCKLTQLLELKTREDLRVCTCMAFDIRFSALLQTENEKAVGYLLRVYPRCNGYLRGYQRLLTQGTARF